MYPSLGDQRAVIESKITATRARLSRLREKIPVAPEQRKAPLQRIRQQTKAKLTRLQTRLSRLGPSPTQPGSSSSSSQYWWEDGATAPPTPVSQGTPSSTPSPASPAAGAEAETFLEKITNNPTFVYVVGGVLLFMLLGRKGTA